VIGFLVRNWRLKLLAVIFAVLAWVGVVYAANPPGVRAVQVPVPQPPTQTLPAGYLLTEPIPPLTVEVAGTADHLNAFSVSFLHVDVDYAAISAVGNRVPAVVSVPVRVTNTDPNVQLSSVPASVQAEVDRRGTAQAAVTVAIGRNLPPGFVMGPQTVSPSTVRLSGPEHELIGAVVKTQPIDLINQESNYIATLNVYVYDTEGHQLNEVSTDPATVTVQITVDSVHTSRTVGVVLGPVHGLAPGYQVTAISYSPPTVILSGEQVALNGSDLSTVTTAAVDLGGLTGTRTYVVQVPSPQQGISVSPDTVTLTVTIAPIPTPSPAPSPTPAPTTSPGTNPTPPGG
jgi:YbbR domain-containing protein